MVEVRVVADRAADAQSRVVTTGTTALDVLGTDRSTVAARVNGELRDLAHVLDDGDVVAAVKADSEDGRAIIRHSCAHVLAQAVQDGFAKAKLGIGPPIENGFYYDFDIAGTFSPEDLARLQKRMREIIKSGQRFRRRVVSEDEARSELADEPYKLELIGLKGPDATSAAEGANVEVGGAELTIYDNLDRKTGEICWKDLCRGPHVPDTRYIPAFQLTRTAAAYWRGSERNPQLQRIYGTAWEDKAVLKDYLHRLEEAQKRDHRRLGEALDLFTFSPEVGKGLPLWMPNGTVIREELEGWARETERRLGYQRVATPHITKDALYYLSGHLPYYLEDLYPAMELDDGEEYYLKPMNCPHHHMLYKARPRSYRDLPVKLAEYGSVYRYERSGQVQGIMRTRGFTQNDAHIYCTLDQAKDQFLEVMRMHNDYYRALGIADFWMVLATRGPGNKDKYHDDEQMWQDSEHITREAMEESNIPYVEDPGGAAHYGPKVDFMFRTVAGKPYAASTNQVDLYTPSRFGLTYVGSDGTDKPVAVIHRAPLGSHERFIGFLTEHFGGAFPVWLAPEQARVIPVMPDLLDYAYKVRDVLFDAGLRVDVDASDARLPAKVRLAVTRKIPLILVVGRREAESQSVTVRYRSGEEVPMSVDTFVEHAQELVHSKSLEGAGHLPPSGDTPSRQP